VNKQVNLKRNRLIHTENKSEVAREEVWRGMVKWMKGIERYKLLVVK